MTRTKVAIIGSGNIGTDLMIKVMRTSQHLQMAAMVGIDPVSDGLAHAKRFGFATTHEGVEGLMALPDFDEIEIVFDATSAKAHEHNASKLQPLGKRLIDLTPAAIGPYVVPAVNLEEHLDAPNTNMVTCGGQATIPMVAAISRVVPVEYAEIVASIASKSAGPGTRANIDEFTETTSAAIVEVGGARRGKAIIILNPAEPPLILRDGMHAVRHRITPEDVQRIVLALDDAGVDAIEVAHGDGLAGSSVNYGPGSHTDWEWIEAAASVLKNARLTTLLLPGVGTIHELRHAYHLGVRSVRVATHCTEADVSAQHIETA